MGISISKTNGRKIMKQKIEPVCFPISMYDKYLLKSNWNQLAAKQVEFGVGLFERYLKYFLGHFVFTIINRLRKIKKNFSQFIAGTGMLIRM